MRRPNHQTRSRRLATVGALATLVMQTACGADHPSPAAPAGAPLPTPAPITTQPITTQPIGGLDAVFAGAPGFASATGWVAGLAPDTPVDLELTVDGVPAAQVRTIGPTTTDPTTPEGVRVDFGLDARVAEGEHDVCVSILDSTDGSTRPLGCERITVDEGTANDRFVQLTAVTPDAVGATVGVRGVVNAGSGEAPASISLAITPDRGDSSVAVAPVERDTFRIDLTELDIGRSTICPIGPDDSFDTTCGTVVVGDLTVAAAGSPTSKTAVEPHIGHPLNATCRDAGVSVQLSDGSVMWFFGDTSARASTGAFDYFVNNTVAWATQDEPAVTLDAVDPAGQPFEFVTPTQNFCEANIYPKPVYWPEAAISIAKRDGTDRVLLFVSEVCVGSGYFSFEGVGMALVEVVYDPKDRPAGRRITGRVVNDDIGTIAEPYGRAAVLAADDHVYMYQCGSLVDPHERCTVARAPAQSVPETSTWRYWNGDDWTLADSWSTDPAAAAAMLLPPGTDVPIAAFTTTHDETINAYVMAYSTAPVYCDRISIRISATPIGPWTPAVEVSLDGCMDNVGGTAFACYAATAQPAFSETGQLGLGYFDQFDANGEGRGEYFAITAQFAVAGTDVSKR